MIKFSFVVFVILVALNLYIFHFMATVAPANRALWLNAWHDPVASIHTVSSCIRIADVTGDGDPKLLIADQNRTLRMYKGNVNDNSLQLIVHLTCVRII